MISKAKVAKEAKNDDKVDDEVLKRADIWTNVVKFMESLVSLARNISAFYRKRADRTPIERR